MGIANGIRPETHADVRTEGNAPDRRSAAERPDDERMAAADRPVAKRSPDKRAAPAGKQEMTSGRSYAEKRTADARMPADVERPEAARSLSAKREKKMKRLQTEIGSTEGRKPGPDAASAGGPSGGFWRGKRVLVTGHTGFKGSWLAIWLHELGAEVVGVALDPATGRDNYVLSGIGRHIAADLRADIRDGAALAGIFAQWRPEIVFHLAAQPLVRLSYERPVETYETNVMGTVHVLEAIRATESVRVGVMITTDKCYENREQVWGYRENEPMGGYDPYSSSKGAAELAIASWRRSYFNPERVGEHGKSIASVRAGNVIGGGDWAADRILPDCIRALEAGRAVGIRSPRSVRPWQHVLEPLGGYMTLAQRMWEEPAAYCEGWNFGPRAESVAPVWEVASEVVRNWGGGRLEDLSDPHAVHEANLLMLDIGKARFRLGWEPRTNLAQGIALTVDWYKRYRTEPVYGLCVEQIGEYMGCDVR